MNEVRLIDANTIKLEKGFFEKVDNVSKFYEWLGKQPTVDAVPVEWIESYVRDACATGDFSDDMCAVAIEAMLNDYRADGERRSE